jgi:hypothetical protein
MRLKLIELNAQDLFLRLEYPLAPSDLEGLSEAQWRLMAPADAPIKPLAKLRGLARVFVDERPDVAMLCEVGGAESLAAFARLFLADAWEPLLVPGNSERGIDCGFLVRRGLGLATRLISHRDWPVPFHYPHELEPDALRVTALIATGFDLGRPEERRLSRDVPALELTAPGAAAPGLVLLLAHLKSGLDAEGFDPRGVVRRGAEAAALLAIRAATQARLPPGTPVIIAGDLNASAARGFPDPELAAVHDASGLEDALQLAGRERHERITHLGFYDRRVSSRQLDYILIPESLHARVDKAATYVYRWRFEGATDERQLPASMRERYLLPSDHYPVVCVVDVDTLG